MVHRTEVGFRRGWIQQSPAFVLLCCIGFIFDFPGEAAGGSSLVPHSGRMAAALQTVFHSGSGPVGKECLSHLPQHLQAEL